MLHLIIQHYDMTSFIHGSSPYHILSLPHSFLFHPTFRALLQLKMIIPDADDGLSLGNLCDPSIYIAVVATILIGLGFHYEFKGAYVLGLAFASICYWTFVSHWPDKVQSLYECLLL